MSDEIQTVDEDRVINELLQRDVNSLPMAERARYLWWYAVRRGLDPLSQPYQLVPNKRTGQLIIYATRSATDQQRKLHNISIEVVERGPLMLGTEARTDVYVVRARAALPDGRFDESLGAVGILNTTGEELANAVMKAETKAKRRATLSLLGEGIPDESELGSWSGPPMSIKPQLTGPRRIEVPAMPEPEVVEAEVAEPVTPPTVTTTSAPVTQVTTTAPKTMATPRPPLPTPVAPPRRFPPAVAPVPVKP